MDLRWLLLQFVAAAATTTIPSTVTVPPVRPTAQAALVRLAEVETDAVRRAFDVANIVRGSYTEVEMQTENGPLKVVWLWLDYVQGVGNVTIQSGGSSVVVTTEHVAQAVEVQGCSPIIMSLGAVTSPVFVSNVEPFESLEEGANGESLGLSLHFWSHKGRPIDMPPLRTPMTMQLPANQNATCAYWDATPVAWSSAGVTTERASDALVCRTTHLGIAGGVQDRQGLEAERLRAAAAALGAMEAAEAAGVQQVLQMALPKGSEVEVQTDAGPLKVVVLPDSLPAEGLAVNASTASVLVNQEHLAMARAIAGGDVLVSLGVLSANSSAFLSSDHVLGRRLKSITDAENGNLLQSDALSINFWTGQGSRVDVQGMSKPMVMTLSVQNENATCAYWDEQRAKWSEAGVTSLPNSNPQAITCSTTHLSIFGGVIGFVFRNIFIALKCSTLAGLLTSEALQRFLQGFGLGTGAAWINNIFLLLSLICLFIGIRWDLKADETLSRHERELLLLRTSDQPKKGDGDEEVQDDDEEENGLYATCFEGVKSVTEQVLDVVLQASGGATWIEAVKETVSNFHKSAVNNCVGMLQTHRVGACADSVEEVAKLKGQGGTKALTKNFTKALQDSDEDRWAQAKDHSVTVKTGENLDLVEEKGSGPSGSSPDGSTPPGTGAVSTVQPVSPDPVPPDRGEGDVATDAAFQELHKVDRFYEKIHEEGSGAASSFLKSNFFVRIFVLFPAAHPMVKLIRFSLVMPYTIRLALFVMKILSCGALAALFFSSSAPDPDSDPECEPPEDFWADLIQSTTVGLTTAVLGDVFIFFVYMIQKKKVIERDEWTEETKAKQRWWWRTRAILFWIFASLYIVVCQLYCWLFLANVPAADAALWMESVAVGLLHDFVFKPMILALILATISSMVLLCKPTVRGEVEDEWIEQKTLEAPPSEDAPKAVPEKAQETPGDFEGVLPGMPM